MQWQSGNVTDRKPLILIYTVPQKNRPTYRRGILNALCYPEEHIVEYSYQRRHIADDLLQELDKLNGKQGVIVLVDFDPSGTAVYYPVRRVKIHSVVPWHGPQAAPSDRERVNLVLSLGDYLDHGPRENELRWHEKVSEFDDKRKFLKRESTGKESPTYFVIEGNDNFPTSPHSLRLAWQETVRVMSETNLLAGATFLRLDHITSVQPKEKVSRDYEKYSLVYSLHPGKVYRLDFTVFEKEERETRIEVSSSSDDLLEIGRTFQAVVSGLAEKSSLIACKRTIENRLVALSVNVGKPSGVVNTPDPILLARVSVSWTVLWGFILYVFLGTFLVSLDVNVVQEIVSYSRPAVVVWALKIVGAGFLARAAFLAFRRLPHG